MNLLACNISKNLSAYSVHVSFDPIKLTGAILSAKQSDTSFGCFYNALTPSIKKLLTGAFWDCLRVLSRNARASGILVKGYDKASSCVLIFPKETHACQSSLRMSVLFSVFDFFLETSCDVVTFYWFKDAYFFFISSFYSFIDKGFVTFFSNLPWI